MKDAPKDHLTLDATDTIRERRTSYALTQMVKLEKYLDDDRLAIDNNASERAEKNIVLGQKNFLFFGSDAGSDNAAIIYTLIETAKLNKIKSEAWLTHLIQTIGGCKQTQLNHLLPWNWKTDQ
ncbi:MAG: transposase [Pseudomonadota bacterium]